MPYLFVSEGIPVFNNANHGFSGVQFYFIPVVIIEFGRIVISGFFPVHMDSFPVGEKISVPGGVMILEAKITLRIPHFMISELYKNIFESELCIIEAGVHMGLSVFISIEQAVLSVIFEIRFRYGIAFGHIYFFLL